ncbi:hypothetical protein [Cupriavidus oxalaticus]|uniref:hypothetical protein n=1 Tax=Cupriavidus oxalaticus TaxID=96344 RepID=UPI0012452BAE|nr:hypothetical protein [Cupriavidus oxalaticus]
MQLEKLRRNDVGDFLAWIPSLGEDATSHLTYIQFSQLAFYYSAEQIEQLEFSTNHIRQGNAPQSAIGMWFISIEAYINSIIRICCLTKRLSFDEIKTKDFGHRIKSLLEILEIDRRKFYRNTFQKLEEFKQYRNELFHDRTNDKSLTFQKTAFSGNPMRANQVDVMQAANIAIDVFHSLRHVIPRLDLMPQIMVTKEDSFFYAKLDLLYHEVLRPHFLFALKKHSLTSGIELDTNASILQESSIFSATPVEIIVKAIPDQEYGTSTSADKTFAGRELLNRFRQKVDFDTKKLFKLGDYYRQVPTK